jgi:eukaryotic-like serine/threonine-protein kinase
MSSSLQPGSTLSHYRIISPLGAGGMGEVYMAQDESLERAVALKVLPPELVKSEERVRRFIQEAKSASSLSHPHIVTIYEIGKAAVRGSDAGDAVPSASEPIHFIAMELISGETLKQKIHGEKTDLKILLRFLAQAADGLAKAHAAGIIHRDLKPENIMISRDGYAKVLDFGLAKLTERREGVPDATTALTATREQTREGSVMGTVAYMSPEQVQARSIDHRSDIFSFGSILYEAATRTKPFTADSDLEVMHKILRDKPAPIEELNPEVPSELRRLIRRCMAKAPDQRLQSMKDLSIELSEIAEEFDELSASATSHGSGSRASAPALRSPVAGSRSLRLAVAAVAILGFAGVGFGFYSWLRGRNAGAAAPQSFQSMKMTRLTNSGKVEGGAISPDGKYLASVVKDKGGYSLWVKQVVTGSDVQVAQPLPTPFRGVTFSTDGNYLYYVNQETGGPGYSILYQIPVLGGTARKLLFDIDTAVTFSPDGKRLAFMRGYPQEKQTVLMVAGADGSGERKLVVRTAPETFQALAPSWSPDGRRLAVIRASSIGGAHNEVATVDVETGKEAPLGNARWGNLNDLSWVPDGSGLVLTGFEEKGNRKNQVWFLSYPAGQARKVTNDLNQYAGLSITADSTTLATAQTNAVANLWTQPAAGPGEVRQLTFGAGSEDAIFNFSIAPNGIFFAGRKGDNSHIWFMDPDGARRTQLTLDSSDDGDPLAPSGGGRIVFGSRREDGLPHLWRMDRDGGNRVQITHGAGEVPVAVSPDGGLALYLDISDGGLAKVSTDGSPPQKLTGTALGDADFSPDGKRIVYSQYIQEGNLLRRHLTVIGAEGGQPIGKTIPWPDGFAPRWDPSGTSLIYAKETEGVGNLWSQPLDGSPPKQITNFTAQQIFAYDWSPDGKQLFLSRGQTSNDVVLISDFH